MTPFLTLFLIIFCGLCFVVAAIGVTVWLVGHDHEIIALVWTIVVISATLALALTTSAVPHAVEAIR